MTIRSRDDRAGLERVGRIAAELFDALRHEVRPGVTTAQLVEPIVSAGASQIVEGSDGWTEASREIGMKP